MSSEWVLPEKYEEGLLDDKGEPLSKRCVSERRDGVAALHMQLGRCSL